MSEDITQEEHYTEQDVQKAMVIAYLRETDSPKLKEALEAARAVRVGYIRQTQIRNLNTESDGGKTVRRSNPTRQGEVLTHVMGVPEKDEAFYLVLDGHIWELPGDDQIWIDDNSIPEDEN